MLDSIKRFFTRPPQDDDNSQNPDSVHDIHVATCALFVELARIDDSFTEEEMKTVLSILKEKYGLSAHHADALIAEAEKELEESVDLWQFARLINENYSNEEKLDIIETLWRIVYVDGKMDPNEHYLMNKLSSLLRLTHPQLIEAKLKVLHSK